MTKRYNSKITLSGNLLEIVEYEKTQFFGYSKKATAIISVSDKKENREKSVKRAVKTVRNYIATNYKKGSTKFITLVVGNSSLDMKQAKKRLEKFNAKLKNIIGDKPKYVGVVEQQKNGNIHFHIVYFNLKYLEHDQLLQIWKHGSAYIEPVTYGYKSFNCLSSYMLKQAKNKKENEKLYFNSLNNLQKPKEIKNDLDIDKMLKILAPATIVNTYIGKNEYVGEYTLKTFDVSKLDINLLQQIMQ